MNCYNHQNSSAVAQCSVCGKGLCKDCADKYAPDILCDDCAREQNRHPGRTGHASRGMLTASLILFGIPAVGGFLFFIGSLLVGAFGGLSDTGTNAFTFLGIGFGMGLALGGAPFGFRFFWRFWLSVLGGFHFSIVVFSGIWFIFSLLFDAAFFIAKLLLLPALALGFGWIIGIVEWIRWFGRRKNEPDTAEEYDENDEYTVPSGEDLTAEEVGSISAAVTMQPRAEQTDIPVSEPEPVAGRTAEAGFRFCRQCGASVNPRAKFCRKCGAENPVRIVSAQRETGRAVSAPPSGPAPAGS